MVLKLEYLLNGKKLSTPTSFLAASIALFRANKAAQLIHIGGSPTAGNYKLHVATLCNNELYHISELPLQRLTYTKAATSPNEVDKKCCIVKLLKRGFLLVLRDLIRLVDDMDNFFCDFSLALLYSYLLLKTGLLYKEKETAVKRRKFFLFIVDACSEESQNNFKSSLPWKSVNSPLIFQPLRKQTQTVANSLSKSAYIFGQINSKLAYICGQINSKLAYILGQINS